MMRIVIWAEILQIFFAGFFFSGECLIPRSDFSAKLSNNEQERDGDGDSHQDKKRAVLY